MEITPLLSKMLSQWHNQQGQNYLVENIESFELVPWKAAIVPSDLAGYAKRMVEGSDAMNQDATSAIKVVEDVSIMEEVKGVKSKTARIPLSPKDFASNMVAEVDAHIPDVLKAVKAMVDVEHMVEVVDVEWKDARKLIDVEDIVSRTVPIANAPS